MKLINANELLKSVGSYNRVKYTYEYGEVVTVGDIKSMPSIDAIPVEWIKKYTEENRLYQSDDFDFYISDMLADWKSEREEE